LHQINGSPGLVLVGGGRHHRHAADTRKNSDPWTHDNSTARASRDVYSMASTIFPRTMEESALKHTILDALEPRRELHLRDANTPCTSTVGPCSPKISRLSRRLSIL
jgi:hypothetical protein